MKVVLVVFVLGLLIAYGNSGCRPQSTNYLTQLDLKLSNAQQLCEEYLIKGNLPDDALRHALAKSDVQVLDTSGNLVISNNRQKDGANILEVKDTNGKFFVKDIITDAQLLRSKETGTIRYYWQNVGDKNRLKIVRFIYMKDWKWIIFAGDYEEVL